VAEEELNGVGCREWRLDESHGDIECIGLEAALGLIGGISAHVCFIFADGDLFTVKEHAYNIGDIRVVIDKADKEFSIGISDQLYLGHFQILFWPESSFLCGWPDPDDFKICCH